MPINDIFDTPYASFLEDSIKAIVEECPESICYLAKLKDGAVLTGYYNADVTDKAIFISNIQSDVVMDVVTANADRLKAALDALILWADASLETTW